MRAPVIGDAWNDYRRFVESASVKRAVPKSRNPLPRISKLSNVGHSQPFLP